jgi:Fe-S-cluster-containing dehydrogenase component
MRGTQNLRNEAYKKYAAVPKVLAKMEGGPNWDEDIGQGKTVNDAWFYYLPINCMHCQEPKCIPACPEKAIYKRADGTVLIDPELCQGAEDCVDACPYKRIFINNNTSKAEKCILCYPRVEKGMPPVFGPNAIDNQGNDRGRREDDAYLKKQFSPVINQVKSTMEKERSKPKSELMDVLCAYPTWKI